MDNGHNRTGFLPATLGCFFNVIQDWFAPATNSLSPGITSTLPSIVFLNLNLPFILLYLITKGNFSTDKNSSLPLKNLLPSFLHHPQKIIIYSQILINPGVKGRRQKATLTGHYHGFTVNGHNPHLGLNRFD